MSWADVHHHYDEGGGPADECEAKCPGSWSEPCDWPLCPRRPAAPPPAVQGAPWDGLRTSEEWCQIHQVTVHDPDGWRTADAPSWFEPITEAEFLRRMATSTISLGAPGGES